MRISIILIIIFITSTGGYAQDSTFKYSANLYFSGATDQTPFWMHANQNGVFPLNGNFASGQFALHKIYNPNNPRLLQWRGSIEAVTNYGKTGSIFLSDAYIAGKMGMVELMAGQRKAVTGIMDTTLSTGSLAMSGNSRPFPRLQISIPDFYPLSFTNYILAVKASYSDGILGSSNILYGSTRYVPHTYFHQKTIYFRIGGTVSPVLIYAGINHQAIWGGEKEISPLYHLDPLDAYWHVVTGKTQDYKKIGNHFGTIDLAGEWRTKKWSYTLYRQTIYNSGSSFKLINPVDGLNGFSIKRREALAANQSYFALQSLLFEFVNTQDQTAAFNAFNLAIFDKADYYNHYIYQSGWSYRGRTMGTPLISGSGLLRKDAINSDTEFSSNNRVIAFHAGATATWLKTTLLLKSTYSRNRGTYLHPYTDSRSQVSFLLSAEKKSVFWKNTGVIVSVASDLGKLYPNSTSVMIGFKKAGFI